MAFGQRAGHLLFLIDSFDLISPAFGIWDNVVMSGS
jgi:hypothetical protein